MTTTMRSAAALLAASVAAIVAAWWWLGRPVAMDIAWVVLPELTIQPARQEYTLLERGAAGARWRFRSRCLERI